MVVVKYGWAIRLPIYLVLCWFVLLLERVGAVDRSHPTARIDRL
jgi:hypothetical protein